MKVFQIRNRRSKLRKSQHLADRGNWSDLVLTKLVKIGGGPEDFFVAGAGRVFSAQGEFFVVFCSWSSFVIRQFPRSSDESPKKLAKKGRRGDRMVGVGRIDNKKEIPTKSAKAFDLFEEEKMLHIFSLF